MLAGEALSATQHCRDLVVAALLGVLQRRDAVVVGALIGLVLNPWQAWAGRHHIDRAAVRDARLLLVHDSHRLSDHVQASADAFAELLASL